MKPFHTFFSDRLKMTTFALVFNFIYKKRFYDKGRN